MSQDVEETSKKNDEEVKENLIAKEEASNKSKKEAKKEAKEEAKEKEEEKNDIKNELVSAQEETKSWKDKYYYIAAELENARKRFSREKEKLIKFGNDQILSELIDVIDNFDHSIAALDKEKDEKSKIILDGVHMVRKQFLDVLSKNGLKDVEAIGKIFDPNFHEAIAKQPAEGKKEDEIVAEYQRGYTLNGRLLRPSKVIVAKKK